MKYTPAVQAKIARLPQSIQTLVGTKFDDDDIKAFMAGLSDEKIESFVELWDHSTTNNKYKIDLMVTEEANIKNVDEVAELVTAFADQFKERFRSAFTAEKIEDELKFQYRKRTEANMEV